MHFKMKIGKHQAGQYDFSEELIKLSKKESLFKPSYQKVKSSVYLEDHDRHYYKYIKIHWDANATKPEEYIAAHIQTLVAKHCKHAYKKYFTVAVNNGDGYGEFNTIHTVYAELHRMGLFYLVDDFEKIPHDVSNDFTEGGQDALNNILYTLKHTKINGLTFKQYKARLKKDIEDAIYQTLDDIFNNVDTKRSEKEIVAFINQSVDKRVYRSLNKINGTREFNRDGKRYFISAQKMKLNDYDFEINKTFKISFYKLTAKQQEFAEKLIELLGQAKGNQQSDVFVFDEKGKVIAFNKRHFANLMEIEESTFKKMLARINEKYIESDWYNLPQK